MNIKRNKSGQFIGNKPITKKCLNCPIIFTSFASLNQKYHSKKCYYKSRKGVRISIKTEFIEGRKNPHKGDSNWINSGTFKENHIGMKKESNPNWQGGITPLNTKVRNSKKFCLWRDNVFKRDNWTCQKYGIVGGKLTAHHIQNFAQYPELRFEINNGITLSKKAHQEFHRKYGIKNNTREQIEVFLK